MTPEMESWLWKSEQRDKWSFCLKAAGMRAPQERPDETVPPETRIGFQGEGAFGGRQRRRDAGRVGSAVRHLSQPDRVEGPASSRRVSGASHSVGGVRKSCVVTDRYSLTCAYKACDPRAKLHAFNVLRRPTQLPVLWTTNGARVPQ